MFDGGRSCGGGCVMVVGICNLVMVVDEFFFFFFFLLFKFLLFFVWLCGCVCAMCL